jgi:coenzyme F420-reducing hydrogenase delta subunit/NAD-dependent dihydropyrimidine dehydrogenase PreA subunit
MRSETICVLGDSACARKIVAHLVDAGKRVIVAAGHPPEKRPPFPEGERESGSLETLLGMRLAECSGGPGNFELVFEGGGGVQRRTVAAVVVAEPEERRANFELYGLKPGARVVAVSELPTTSQGFRHIVFLNGLVAESHPVVAGEVMRAAHRLQVDGRIQIYILTRNLKVASDGLEALSREARSAGVLFFKFTAAGPEIRQSSDGRVHIHFIDEPSGNNLNLDPDLVVVDESMTPSAATVELGRLLQIEADSGGFIQGDNVHRLTVSTNRRGVIVAGAARCAGAEPEIEASNAVLEALAVDLPPDAVQPAEIEPGRCIRCLTCFRVCPYRAIALNTRPTITAAACESCGICAAECPREAIRMPGLERHELLSRVAAGRPAERAGRPYIVAFCCRRSAGVAARESLCERRCWEATINVIEVPCAGSLPPALMLSAFGAGADGVLVLTCHEDNCHSRQGNCFARTRAEQTAAFLKLSGASQQRLVFKTLAANMGKEFVDIVTEFGSALRGPGHDHERTP